MTNPRRSMRLEWTEECSKCGGNGLYVGMAERDGAAVVCRTCDGTGRVERRHEYYEFSGRREREDITQVYATSAGIVLAPNVVFGGVSYSEWKERPESVYDRGVELRQHVCPKWWAQSVGKPGPAWKPCVQVNRFSDCWYFGDKSACWAAWDTVCDIQAAEQKGSEEA